MEQFFEQVKEFFASVWAWLLKFGADILDWFESLDVNNLTKLFYILSLFVLILGIIGLLFKDSKRTKELKTTADSLKSSAQRLVDLAANPTEEVAAVIEEGKTVVKGIKLKIAASKIGQFFQSIWANKNSIFAIIASSVSIILAEFYVIKQTLDNLNIAWFNEHPYVVYIICICFGIITLITDIRCIVTKYGWESLDEFAERVGATKADKVEKAKTSLKGKNKEKFEAKITLTEGAIAEAKTKLATLEAKADELNKFMGLGSSAATLAELAKVQAEIAEIKSQLA